MGIDWLDIRFRLEKGFKFPFPDATLPEIAAGGRDITLGGLHDLLCRMEAARRSGVCLNVRIFRRVRTVLREFSGQPRAAIGPRTPLESLLLPPCQATWNDLRTRLGWELPPLAYSRRVQTLLCIVSLILTALAVSTVIRWKGIGPSSMSQVLEDSGVWTALVLMLVLPAFLQKRWRTRIPRKCATVFALVRTIRTTNFITDDDIRLIDQDDVWRRLCLAVSDALCIPTETMSRDSRLFADLGCD